MQNGERGGNANPHAYNQIRDRWKTPNVLPNAFRQLIFIVNKKSGTLAGIQPTTFGVPTHHWATEALVTRVAIGRLNRQSFYFWTDSTIIARTLTCGDPYRCNGFPNLLTESYNLHGYSHMIVSYNAEQGTGRESQSTCLWLPLKNTECIA